MLHKSCLFGKIFFFIITYSPEVANGNVDEGSRPRDQEVECKTSRNTSIVVPLEM